MRLAIRHELTVLPPPGTTHLVAQLLLTPQNGPGQKIESWSVEAPGIGNAGRYADAYGNTAHLINQSRPEGALTIVVNGVVETTDRHGVLGRVGGEPVPALYRRATPLTKVGNTGKIKGKDTTLDTLHALMARVGEALGTRGAQTQMAADGSMSQSQATELPPASDYAHAFIGAARGLDIPARYVTGYILGEDGDGLHAWAEAFDDRLGWIGFDPRLQICPTDRHVRLAAGLDSLAAAPVRLYPALEVSHSVSVTDSQG